MEEEVITKLRVLDTDFTETEYEVYKVGPESYLAKPTTDTNSLTESQPDIYIEKSSEGWQHFPPLAPGLTRP